MNKMVYYFQWRHYKKLVSNQERVLYCLGCAPVTIEHIGISTYLVLTVDENNKIILFTSKEFNVPKEYVIAGCVTFKETPDEIHEYIETDWISITYHITNIPDQLEKHYTNWLYGY